MLYKKIILSLAILFVVISGHATVPNWAVRVFDFNYQMTMVGKVSITCNFLEDSNVLVAAFVNDTCRGVIKNNIIYNNKYYTSITIYSNKTSGDKIVFKIYNPKTDSIYSTLDTVDFVNNNSIGNYSTPFVYTNNYKPELITISSNYILKTSAISSSIADLTTKDRNHKSFVYTILPDTSTNPEYFALNGNVLQLNKEVLTDSRTILKVRIQTDDMNGCSYDSIFTFNIINNEPAPTNIFLSNNSILEHSNVNTYIGKLTSEDKNLSDKFSYQLVSGIGSEGNSKFLIVNDSLFSNFDYEYDSAKSYTIRIRTIDLAQNTFDSSFVINILELINPSQPLKANDLVTPNGDNINEVFEIENVGLYSEYKLEIFDDNGSLTNSYNKGFVKDEAYKNTWNGISDVGKTLTTGLYLYHFSSQNNGVIFKGKIYLLRKN